MNFLFRYNLEKILLGIATLVIFSGCIATKTANIENHIGLYKIVNAECKVAQNDFDPCKYDLFFELVKGQFIGVKDSQLAYVFWSGDPKIDSELQYTSHLISNHKSKKIFDDKFWLSKDNQTQEYLIFSDKKLSGYYAIYNANDDIKRRIISYELKPILRSDFPHIQLNYPGNK